MAAFTQFDDNGFLKVGIREVDKALGDAVMGAITRGEEVRQTVAGLAPVAGTGKFADLDLAGVPYDIAIDYPVGAPSTNEHLLEIMIPRPAKLAEHTRHYVKTLVERPTIAGGLMLDVCRIRDGVTTVVLKVSYGTDGVGTVTEPAGTDRNFLAGDILRVVCIASEPDAKNPKLTLVASLT